MATTRSEPLLQNVMSSHMPNTRLVEDREIDLEFPSKSSRWGSTRKFGLSLVIGLPLALLAILGPLGFLWYLWTSHAGNDVWRRIMAEEYCTRVVALLSMVIRTAVIFQATACTSMLAAYILERGLLLLSKVAGLSAIRYVNGGPHNLLLLFAGSGGIRRKLGTGLFAFSLLLTTLLSQLTSTALLSDLHAGLVPGNYGTTQLPFRLNDTYTSDSSRTASIEELWSNKPPFYPMFAEFSETATPYQDNSIEDTGMTLRAFLPLSSEQTRSLVRNYTGPGTVFDSRVVCMRPSISISDFSSLGDFDGQTLALIQGIVQVSANAPGVYNVPAPTPFECTVIFSPDSGATEWAVTVCGLDTPGVLVSPFQDPSRLNLSYPGPGYIPGTLSYMVVNTTGTVEQWQAAVGNTTAPNWQYSLQNEWMDLMPGNQSTYVKFSLSVCYGNVYAVDTQINAFSPVERTEPSIVWDIQKGDFDSQAVREQLGATVPVSTPQDRGIMALQSRPSWRINPNVTTSALMFEAENLWYGWTSSANSTLGFCPTCFCCSEVLDLTWVVNRYTATVFQRILQDTQKPALALQAYITTMFQVGYYEDISEFGTVAPTVMEPFVSVLVPSGFVGLICVTAVLMLHLVLVSLAIALFQTRTRYSMLGNSWQAMTQTYALETEMIYARSSVLVTRKLRSY